MSTIVCKEVSTKRRRNGLCSRCGKKCQVTRRFWQTVNPFNRNERGVAKTPTEIMQENARDAAAWAVTPLLCKGCQ